MIDEQISVLAEQLDRIEAAIAELVGQRSVKDWYSTAEVAEIVGKAEYTVREWCRQARVRTPKGVGPALGLHQENVDRVGRLLRRDRPDRDLGNLAGELDAFARVVRVLEVTRQRLELGPLDQLRERPHDPPAQNLAFQG